MISFKRVFFLLVLTLPFLVKAGNEHKKTSVLSSGKWYKLSVWNTGIHKISYEDFQSMGIDPTQIVPSDIRLFGNGGGMLPESNAGTRTDDLRENPIVVNDGGDGQFNPGDYLIFYGESSDKWYFDTTTRTYYHTKNLYSDSTYYFLTFNQGLGKRILTKPSTDSLQTYVAVRFDDYMFQELDQRNLIRSGRVWYGEVFDNSLFSYDYAFNFPDRDSTVAVKMKTYVAARCPVTSRYFLKVNDVLFDSIQVEYTDLQSIAEFAKYKTKASSFSTSKVPLTINLSYKLPTSNSVGWLNYLEISCQRLLAFTGPQMSFRSANSVGKNWVTEFRVKRMNQGVKILDVTDPGDARFVEGTLQNGLFTFRLSTVKLREFIAFDGTSYFTPRYSGIVANQNLHALEPTTLVIVTNPLFQDQAAQLAGFHQQENGMSVTVVPTKEIYNEFGCGQKDPTAIRDFMKMLYDRGAGKQPKYLLLFGDGSYDPKDRIPGNNNMIPTFQSTESLKFLGTYVCEDYFGIMGDKEGQESNGSIEIGIGRFPVSTTEQAQLMIDKIEHYSSHADSVMTDWRNTITFVADDENDNLHLQQAQESSGIVAKKYPVFNVNKIYLDAYPLVKIPAGSRFPEVNKAINQAVAKGTLLINYTGHGGESGWAYEQVLTLADIESWTNWNELPVFVTATCEFSRFDNPERFTGGEMVILHPKGGGIAMYSTTRLALSTSNQRLDTSFFHHLMDKRDGEYVTMGDLIRISKNNNSNNNNIRNFALLGDPAQRIAFPENRVKTIGINGRPVSGEDTIRGYSRVQVSGIIENQLGQKLSGFNGVLHAKVFDKPVTNNTLGNTTDSYPTTFKVQNSLLYEVVSKVDKGIFNFDFVVPKEIALQFGRGKISYYAWNGIEDANGYTDAIVVGGRDTLAEPGDEGPDITLAMDRPGFVSGGTTSMNPVLLADLYDNDGINFVGLGLGHEITLVLDGDQVHPVVLNDYYVPAQNTISGGSLVYGFSNLAAGRHTLTIKAWDMFNNSSEKAIDFVVSSQLSVTNIINYPNPMSDYTTFWFVPMEDSGKLDVEIDIYNIMGSQVMKLNYTFNENFSGPGYSWDGTDANGKRLSNGIYPYKVKFRGVNGMYTEASQKLLISR
ncbi:MAG: type IX secretion system sortase PorU [bacterium]